LVVLAVLAGAGYVGYRHFHDESSSTPTAAPRLPFCGHTASGNALFAAPGRVRLRIRNGSLQTGLAAQVRSAMRRRGFHVGSIGNASTVGRNVAAVRFPPTELRAARAVAAQVSGHVVMAPTANLAGVELDLGLRFAGLRPPAAVRAVEQQALASATPSATPSPTASPTCRAS
jgi:hypothetical protein